MSDNPNTPAISRGIGSEISDFFQPARRTLSPALELPLDYLKYLQDMGAAGGYGLYGGASDLSGLGASILGFPEMGDKLFEQADKNYDRAGKFLSQSTDDLYGVDLGVPRPAFVPDDYVPGTVVGDGAGGGASRPMPEDDVEFSIGEQLEKEIAALLPVSRKMDADAQDIESAAADLKSQKAKDFRASERNIARSQGMMSQQEQVDDAFMSALKDFTEAAGKKDEAVQGETREDALARYKKEFEDATGIDASGKVDKSKALMAFGLALMQNKAGKDFNVGKMLGAVGEAGEAAMPALEKAQDKAAAARLAAGKYAIQQINNDKNAKAALAAEQRTAAREAQLKFMEFQQDVYLKKLEGKEVKDSKKLEIIPGLDILIGTSDGKAVFSRPEFTARTVGNAYRTTQTAMSELGKIEDAILDVQASESPALKIVTDRFNTFLVGVGMKNPNVTFGPEGVSPEQQAQALRDSLIAEFKRFLTQETGNGISNVDIQNMERLMGKMNIFGNPQDAINRLDQVRGIFEAKATALTPFINDLSDPYYYVNDSSFEKAQEALAMSMGYGGSEKQPSQTKDGRTTIDLTGG